MKVVGITGSIGSGKSSVSKYIRQMGYEVIDADEIVRILYKKEEFLKSTEKLFSQKFRDINGNFDKKLLSSEVFADEKKRLILNNFVHPIVEKSLIGFIDKERNNDSKIIFIEVPLLIEAGLIKLVDYVILVTMDEELQKKRIMQRDNRTKDEIEKILNVQMSQEEKKKYADFIIENDYSLNNLKKIVETTVEKIIEKL